MGKRKHEAESESDPEDANSKKKQKVRPGAESGDEEIEIKQEPQEPGNETPLTYEELVLRVSVIAKPLASKKLTGWLYKAVRKAAKHKCLRRGVKEVTKSLRKGEKGFVILAGDVSPLDIISHVPVFCEEHSVPYVFVPSRFNLGSAGVTKRPTSVVLLKESQEYKKHFVRCMDAVSTLPHPLV